MATLPCPPAPGSRPRRRLSIGLRARIAVFFAALLLLVNLAVLATQRGPIVQVFEESFEVRGRELALNLAARARPHVTGGAEEGLGDLLETYLQNEDVEGVSILWPRGRAVSAGAPPSGALPDRPEPGTVRVAGGPDGAEYVAGVAGTDALARVRLGRRALAANISRIGWTITAIATAAVGTGFLLVFVAASVFTRPIHQLAALARRIRGGELGAALDLQRHDEIGELAGAMNEMSAQLAENHRRLEGARVALESQNAALRDQGRELEAKTNHLQTLLTSISEAVLFLDRDRRVATANRAAERILGIPGDRVPGLPLAELELPGAAVPLRRVLAEACNRADRDERHEAQTLLADRLHTVTTVHGPAGEALGVLAVIQDLSRVRALEAQHKDLLDQVYQQEKMAVVGLLAASLAHEINTPLGTILLHAQQVARELGDGEPARALAVVEREVHRCRDIVRSLLDFSRLAESRPEVLDLTGPIDRCHALLEAELRRKGITVHRSTAPGIPPVEADPNRIEQVLVNLIWNAVDAMPGGGRIDIALQRCTEGVEVLVRDQGKGISPEHAKRLFEPFFTTKPKGKGTGLGLAICRRIMDEAGGTIRIGPAPEGGTEVRLGFPAAGGSDA